MGHGHTVTLRMNLGTLPQRSMSQRHLLASLLVPVPTPHYSARERELGTPSSAGYPAIRRATPAAQSASHHAACLPGTLGSTSRIYRET